MDIVSLLEINHYSDRLFSFKTSRPKSFRFKNGEFVMIGFDNAEGKIYRAYSIVSPNYEDYLEFLSIKVENGPFTSKLKLLKAGDLLTLKPKTTGSLVIDYLLPKDNLVLLCTGTGIAPFMSIVRDPYTYEKFKNVYLFHTVRNKNELCFKNELNMLMGDLPFVYVESVTREKYHRNGRFWQFIREYIPNNLDKNKLAIMVCGSPSLNKECRSLLSSDQWIEGNTGEMGDFLLERAFVDK